MQMAKQKGRKSSYHRHGKTPYVYSPQYQAWRSAVKTGVTGDKDKIKKASEIWYEHFMGWAYEHP